MELEAGTTGDHLLLLPLHLAHRSLRRDAAAAAGEGVAAVGLPLAFARRGARTSPSRRPTRRANSRARAAAASIAGRLSSSQMRLAPSMNSRVGKASGGAGAFSVASISSVESLVAQPGLRPVSARAIGQHMQVVDRVGPVGRATRTPRRCWSDRCPRSPRCRSCRSRRASVAAPDSARQTSLRGMPCAHCTKMILRRLDSGSCITTRRTPLIASRSRRCTRIHRLVGDDA